MKYREIGRNALTILVMVAAAIAFQLPSIRTCRQHPLKPGDDAPSFSLQTLIGQPVALEELRGHVVLLDFWASWCGSCKAIWPAIEALERELGPRGLKVVTVNVDDDRRAAEAYVRTKGGTLAVAIDDGRVAQAYGVRTIPQLTLIGADGKVAMVQVGGGVAAVRKRAIALLDSREH